MTLLVAISFADVSPFGTHQGVSKAKILVGYVFRLTDCPYSDADSLLPSNIFHSCRTHMFITLLTTTRYLSVPSVERNCSLPCTLKLLLDHIMTYYNLAPASAHLRDKKCMGFTAVRF
jgi:energy-converting hydrogenase Eha subunit C